MDTSENKINIGSKVTVVYNGKLVQGKAKQVSNDQILVKLRSGMGQGNFPAALVFPFNGISGCKKCGGSGRMIPHVKVDNDLGGSVPCTCTK